ncbi:hypothetical protein GLYMA_14G068451v4 [Glycine max]|nr:hypothetical protein GLYMA_14G068451v4 [Glycine max]KAG4382352.1 hypothetical protein GLYMA_14G068451v4 [Glycine max]KAG4382353.1 hypothetical protein GLYMA_14G068451v4 [Glycine max]KAH1093395.1 hypothetical protein GYH30_039241 [Glycine max]KAH1093396.1 hypothetical protein GYH30_039241 [Glycine max]
MEYPGSGDQYKLNLRIMDKDVFSANDFVGQATKRNILKMMLEHGRKVAFSSVCFRYGVWNVTWLHGDNSFMSFLYVVEYALDLNSFLVFMM